MVHWQLFRTNFNALVNSRPIGFEQGATEVHIIIYIRKLIDLVSSVSLLSCYST